MCVVAIGIVYVREAEYVQLTLAASASGIHWKQDRPRNAAAHETHDSEHAKEAKIQVAVQGAMIQYEVIID